jgi:hypothetical protein
MVGFDNIPNIHCYSKWESVESKKLLGNYPNNQIQMVCQFIPKLILHKPQILKTFVIFYAAHKHGDI